MLNLALSKFDYSTVFYLSNQMIFTEMIHKIHESKKDIY